MSAVIYPRLRTMKPPPGAQVNLGHPLARGLVSAWLFGPAPNHSDYGPLKLQRAGNPEPSKNQWDGGALYPWGNSANGDIWYNAPAYAQPSSTGSAITILSRCLTYYASGDNPDYNEQRIIGYGAGDNPDNFGFGLTTFGGNGAPALFVTQLGDHISAIQTTTFNFAAYRWMTIGVSQAGASARVFFKDGLFEANAQTIAPGSPSNPFVYVGGSLWNGDDNDEGGANWYGWISWLYVWMRALTRDEMLWIYTNPYGIFQPAWPGLKQMIWAPGRGRLAVRIGGGS